VTAIKDQINQVQKENKALIEIDEFKQKQIDEKDKEIQDLLKQNGDLKFIN
jgi:hypothetical protein